MEFFYRKSLERCLHEQDHTKNEMNREMQKTKQENMSTGELLTEFGKNNRDKHKNEQGKYYNSNMMRSCLYENELIKN